jgi:hypothetical protein
MRRESKTAETLSVSNGGKASENPRKTSSLNYRSAAHISVSGDCKAFDSRFYPRKFADKNVEDRREKDAEKCHAQHAREDGCPERLTHLGAGSVAEHEWYHPRDECEGGHQDRAQS